MNEAQITLGFMAGAIAITGGLLFRNGAIGVKTLAAALVSTAIIGGFIFLTL